MSKNNLEKPSLISSKSIVDWKKTIQATAVLTALSSILGAKFESGKSEVSTHPTDIQLGELSKVHEVEQVGQSMYPENQSDKILSEIGVKIDFGQEKVPDRWNETASRVQTSNLITFESCGLKENNPVRQEVQKLIDLGKNLDGRERSNYLLEVKQEFEKKFIDSTSDSEKETIMAGYLLFRNEFNSLLKAGEKIDALSAAKKAEMVSQNIDLDEYLDRQYESDYKLYVDATKPLVIKDSNNKDIIELEPDTNIHQLIGNTDIIEHINSYGGVEITNLTDLKDIDPVVYQTITEHNLDKQTEIETQKIAEEINKILVENNSNELDETDLENLQFQVHKTLQKSIESGNVEEVKIPLNTVTVTNPAVKNEINTSKYSIRFPQFEVGKYDVNIVADLLHNYQLFGKDIYLPSISMEAENKLSDAVYKDGFLNVRLSANQNIMVGNISEDMLCQGNLVYVVSPAVGSESDIAMPVNKPSEKFNLSVMIPLIPLIILRLRNKKNKLGQERDIKYKESVKKKPILSKKQISPVFEPMKDKKSIQIEKSIIPENNLLGNDDSVLSIKTDGNEIPILSPTPPDFRDKRYWPRDVTKSLLKRSKKIPPKKTLGQKLKKLSGSGKEVGSHAVGESGGYRYKRKKRRVA